MAQKKVKFSHRSYFKPTPKNLLKLGIALRGVAGTITGAAIIGDAKTPAIIGLIILILGTFLIDFFGEEDK